jgi:hypothetical protein
LIKRRNINMNITFKQNLINTFDNLTSEERDQLIEFLQKRRLELQEQEILKSVSAITSLPITKSAIRPKNSRTHQ